MEISPSRKLFGIVDHGRWVFTVPEDGAVDREQFEYCVAIHTVLFGPKGLVDTLGPTWNMIRDRRFEAVEEAFIRPQRKSVFGGNAREGFLTSLPDGSFIPGIADLEPYSEILGEGRYYHEVLVKANIDPRTFKDQSDEFIWGWIRKESEMQFTRKGEPNRNAQNYFKAFKADLLGLIADYAELAKVQEWILLDGNGTLVEQKDIDDYEENASKQRVWLEIDILERALAHRATLRVTAAMIMKQLRVEEMIVNTCGELTEMERDNLLGIIFGSNWPDDKLELITKITSFLASASLQGNIAQRTSAQEASLSIESQEFIAGLKSGDILPINRYTEETVEITQTEGEIAAQSILDNPLKQFALIRISDVEDRIASLNLDIEMLQSGLPTVIPAPALSSDEFKLLRAPIDEATYDPDYTVVTNYEATWHEGTSPEVSVLLDKKASLQSVVDLLLPVLEPDFILDDETFAKLMSQAEDVDPRTAKLLQVTGDEYDAAQTAVKELN